MKAVLIREQGGRENLKLEEIEKKVYEKVNELGINCELSLIHI